MNTAKDSMSLALQQLPAHKLKQSELELQALTVPQVRPLEVKAVLTCPKMSASKSRSRLITKVR